MFKVVEPTLGKVVRSGRASTASEAEMLGLVQTKLVDDTIIQNQGSNLQYWIYRPNRGNGGQAGRQSCR